MDKTKIDMHTVTEYEQEDYEDFKRNLTSEQTIELLERISRGYLPDYNFTGTENDFEYYCLHQAIYRAIDALQERSEE